MENRIAGTVSADELREFLEKGEGVLIDTLPPEHYEKRHIPGAVSCCVYEVGFVDKVAGAVSSPEVSVILYGAGPKSMDALTAADKLMRAEYDNVAVYPGGIEEWHHNGFSLEGTAPDSLDPPHPVLALEDRVYRLVPEDSQIHWTGRNSNGGHSGTLLFSEGDFNALSMEASFIMDMRTLRNLDLVGDELQPVLEEHLHSDDFFFTTVFPSATFKTSRIQLAEDGSSSRPNGMMQGELSLRGVEQAIAFPVHIRNLDNGRIVVMGNLDFDRTQWGIVYGSSKFFKHLGLHVVFDFISIDFRVVLA